MKFQVLNLKVVDNDTVLRFSKIWPLVPLEGVSLHLKYIRTSIDKTALLLDKDSNKIEVPYVEEELAVLPTHTAWTAIVLHPKGVGRKQLKLSDPIANTAKDIEAKCKERLMELYSTKSGATIRVLDLLDREEGIVVVYLEREGSPDMRINYLQFKPLRAMLFNILKFNL